MWGRRLRTGRGVWQFFEGGEELASICGAVDLVFAAVMLEEKEARGQW